MKLVPNILFSLLLFCLGFSFDGAAQPNADKPVAPDPFLQLRAELAKVDWTAFQRALADLSKNPSYGKQFLTRAAELIPTVPALLQALDQKQASALNQTRTLLQFRRDALLANPLLKFDRLLAIKRKPIGDPRRAEEPDRGIGKFIGLPQQSSWQLQTMPNPKGWTNELVLFSPTAADPELELLFQPPENRLISDVDLHFDADRLLFSMIDQHGFWQLFEIDSSGSGLRQLTPGNEPKIHSHDGCYLPNGNIAFVSTGCFQGVPCNPGVNVGMLYLLEPTSKKIRQLCFEQDHNFCPTVLNDGRLMYLRWEYTDIPHVWARYLFTMNPDGTSQREYYGSGSYWPNAIFYARPVPNHPTRVAGIVTGHHVGRVGELVLLDPALSRYSTRGVVQRIPGFGQPVVPLIQDKLAMDSWPKFVHPFPLSDKYFLVSAKPGPDDLWGIYLVDLFDNMVLLKELEGHALLEPIPFRKTATPPIIPDRVDPSAKTALAYIQDIYEGPGLKGVPRGTIKQLRLFTYQFGYPGVAGIHHRVGADGPWEPKRILGQVEVEEDGSVYFEIPANTPISIQPLNSQGQAVQLMRSWLTAMPGEFVSCTGCHEKQNSAVPNLARSALNKEPQKIAPWFGPVRGFAFNREVQPVLDKHCVSCHDGQAGRPLPDLRADQGAFICYKNGDPVGETIHGVPREELIKKYGAVFDPSYVALRRLVRVGGLESDLRMLDPAEFQADGSELIQILKKGHYGVNLDQESWQRLCAWIDLNAPCHGRWSDVVPTSKFNDSYQKRRVLRARYANIDEDPENIGPLPAPVSSLTPPASPALARAKVELPNWPLPPAEAQRRQTALEPQSRSVTIAPGIDLQFVRIPAGEFVMGDSDGRPDESPQTHVRIAKSFWMTKFEITNDQFAQYDKTHDSRFEDMTSWIFNEEGLGWALNRPRQPVVRVSWEEAMSFCRWLSAKIGQQVSLPTEAQWEYACRAGTDSAFSFGDLNADFSAYANLADVNIRRLAYDARDQFSPDLVPRDARFNDGHLVTTDIGLYRPNAWGLHDMHGNAWEWTRSNYLPYPYADDAARLEPSPELERVVRGGSWMDRPPRARSAFRLSYPSWRKVYNVSFRVIIETESDLQLSKN